jgi:alkylation response protein AidB-like acyl-CoA dehydrogenase
MIELSAFRQEVRAFVAEHLPADVRERAVTRRGISRDEQIAWQQALDDRGWFVGHWPAQHGGQGWSRLQRWVFEQELDHAGSPWLMPFGAIYVAPVLWTFGTPEQQAHHLPRIKRSLDSWAQGYSEPSAGSDLATVSMRAVRDGDHYVVTGQKIWTSYAHWADLMFTLVRTSTDGAPQRGVSFLLVDMTLPGITVRPIETFDGHHHVNEVFFDEVRVPVSDLVGEENKGWTYAKFLLNNERFLAAEVGKARRMIGELKELVWHNKGADHAKWNGRINQLAIDALALEASSIELLSHVDAGGHIGSEPSVLKLLGSELLQRIAGAMLDVLEGTGMSIDDASGAVSPASAGHLREYLFGRAATIYGGTSEVQRNIIAQSLDI